MRVLYINHTGQMSGAERSLLTLLSGLPDSVEVAVGSPDGPFSAAVRDLGLPVMPVREAGGSLKLHPVHTPSAVLDIGVAATAVRQLSRDLRVDLVHANSIRAGVVASLSARLGGAPAIVHVRDRLPPGPLSSYTYTVIGLGAAAVLANSEYTKRHFARPGFPAPIRVVHNPVDLDRFDPTTIARTAARNRLRLGGDDLVLAVLAQITPWKGQDEAIRVVARLTKKHPSVRLLLVGSAKFVSKTTRHDNRAYLRRLEALVESLGLDRQVTFLGEREDIPEILRAVDVLLVPSWEEPFGRAIIEAMGMEVPVVATSIGGPAEILSDGEDGLLLPPKDEDAWVRALERLISSPERRLAMGRLGRERVASRFSIHAHVGKVLAAYGDAMAKNGRPAAVMARTADA